MKKTTIKTAFALLITHCFLLQGLIFAQTDQDINAKIKKEEMENSKIMWTMHYLTDVYGPRLTGSPNHKAAAEWAVRTMTEWGFENAALEPWDFGHPGWLNESAYGIATAPFRDNLTFEVLAWTPSTKKLARGSAFQIVLPSTPAPTPDRPNATLPPTQDELTAYFNGIRDQVKGKIVLVGKPAVIPVNFSPPPKRIDDDTIKRRYDPTATPQPFPSPQPTPTPRPGQLTNPEIRDQLNKFLVDNKVLVRINDAGEEHGKMRAFSNSTYDLKKVVPTVVMRN
jgi:carboxypeptidase Q